VEVSIPKLTAVPITAKDYAVSAVCNARLEAARGLAKTYLEGCKPPEVACGRHCECCVADELCLVVVQKVLLLLQEEKKRKSKRGHGQSSNGNITDDGTTGSCVDSLTCERSWALLHRLRHPGALG
jgi:hypothetical protein